MRGWNKTDHDGEDMKLRGLKLLSCVEVVDVVEILAT